MIKRFCLVVVACISIQLNISAQCVPDTNITNNIPGIYPDSATGLPHAYVGTSYSTVLQIKVPTDTTYLGLPAVIDSINVTGVTGLPSGFTYICTPPNCSFPGGSDACVLLQGPAPSTGMIGSYPIIVSLTIYGKVFGTPQTIQDVNDNYTIVIESSVGLNKLSDGNFSIKQNSPNPFRRHTTIPVNSVSNGKVTIKVTDLIGNVVLIQDRIVQKGLNNLSIDAQNFDAGIYLYTVSDGKHSVTRRLVVSGQNEF
ncbi:MAG: T9SS type A sorting domain-containing protein [Bacteroidia bacterium]|nr:T9SS type A sorting domain-containing protein [Bacteroidia bacterium]